MNPNFPVYLVILTIYCCVERNFSSEIRGYDGDDCDDCCHLMCDAVCTGRNVLMFQMILPPPSSVSFLQFFWFIITYLPVKCNITVQNHEQVHLFNACVIDANNVREVCIVFGNV